MPSWHTIVSDAQKSVEIEICPRVYTSDKHFLHPFSNRNYNPYERSRTEQHQSYYSKDSKIEFPTLHIIGDTDQVIKREMSDDLVGDYFEENVTVIARHPDGHILPTKGDCKATIVDFINKRHAEANA